MSNYNGWSNWETWNAYNWLTNEAPPPAEWAEMDVEGLATLLAEDMESVIEEMPYGWHRDVVAQAHSAVNWRELAGHLSDDAGEYQA